MSSLGISSRLLAKEFLLLARPEDPYHFCPFLFFSFFGPIVSGFYAGMTTRAYRSMLYVCLATSAVAGLYFGTIDRLPYLLLGEMVLVAAFYLAFFLAFSAMGLISAIAVRRLRREILRRVSPVSH